MTLFVNTVVCYFVFLAGGWGKEVYDSGRSQSVMLILVFLLATLPLQEMMRALCLLEARLPANLFLDQIGSSLEHLSSGLFSFKQKSDHTIIGLDPNLVAASPSGWMSCYTCKFYLASRGSLPGLCLPQLGPQRWCSPLKDQCPGPPPGQPHALLHPFQMASGGSRAIWAMPPRRPSRTSQIVSTSCGRCGPLPLSSRYFKRRCLDFCTRPQVC